MIQCLCGKQYVGSTMRILHVCLNEHLGNIKRGFSGHKLSKPYAKYHNRNPEGTLFLTIEKYVPHWRGSHIRRDICSLETC